MFLACFKRIYGVQWALMRFVFVFVGDTLEKVGEVRKHVEMFEASMASNVIESEHYMC